MNHLGSVTRRDGPPQVTPSMGVTPNESQNIFCDLIYNNTGQTITWKGGQGMSGDGTLWNDTKKVITLDDD